MFASARAQQQHLETAYNLRSVMNTEMPGRRAELELLPQQLCASKRFQHVVCCSHSQLLQPLT